MKDVNSGPVSQQRLTYHHSHGNVRFRKDIKGFADWFPQFKSTCHALTWLICTRIYRIDVGCLQMHDKTYPHILNIFHSFFLNAILFYIILFSRQISFGTYFWFTFIQYIFFWKINFSRVSSLNNDESK